MPADNKKLELRSLLAGKTTEELEELIALDFAEDNANLDADYISTILEVIEERENNTEERNKETLAAWNKFQEYSKEAESNKLFEAGKSEEPTPDHRCKIEYRQKSRKHGSAWRMGIVAAVLTVLLCSTAFGWNLFQAIVEWTEETFSFLTGQSDNKLPKQDVLNLLEVAVRDYTDLPAVPHRAPDGTQVLGNLNVIERNNRYSIGMGYKADDKFFTIQIVIHHAIPHDYSGVYQKDASIQEEYVSGGITHYITGNLENLSAAWTNGNIEGHIQGNLTLDEMRQMINSIYEE